MVALKQFVLGSLSANPTGGLGASNEHPLFEATHAFLEGGNAFYPVESLAAATCVDDRLDKVGKRRHLPHLPGGGMTIALMRRYLSDDFVEGVEFLHEECLAMNRLGSILGGMRQPAADLELLNRLDLDVQVQDVLKSTRSRSRRVPANLLGSAPRQESFPEGHNPVMAVVNCNEVGRTVNQELLGQVCGARVLSFDMWAIPVIADGLTDDPLLRYQLKLFGYLVAARTLRTVGSKKLLIAVF